MKRKTRKIKNPYENVNLDSIIMEEVGGLGKFQIRTLLLLIYPIILTGFAASDYVFTAARLQHRCLIPECDDVDPQFETDWIGYAVPISSNGDINDCLRYVPTDSNGSSIGNRLCFAETFDSSQTISCNSYVYSRIDSVVYDFGLECNEWVRSLAALFIVLGAIIGLPFISYISDLYGRRKVVVFSVILMGLVSVIRSFSLNYPMYLVLNFMTAAIGSGTFSGSYILGTEIVGIQYRVYASATISSMYAIGQAIVGLAAWGLSDWRQLLLILYCPAFLVIAYYWLLPESVHWLMSKNKYKEVKNILQKMARVNGNTVSEESLSDLLKPASHNDGSEAIVEKQENLLTAVVHSPVMLRRCCTTPVWWITTNLIYYGLLLNSLYLSGNIYINYSATALVEIPGFWTAVIGLNTFGRKTTVLIGFLISSISCFAFAFVPRDLNNISTILLILFLVGKFGISAVFTSLYLYTSELYPTCDRHKFIAFSSTLGRIGTVVASFSPALSYYWPGIPMVIFGSLSLISALSVLTQPETVGCKLPDTFVDAEEVGTHKNK